MKRAFVAMVIPAAMVIALALPCAGRDLAAGAGLISKGAVLGPVVGGPVVGDLAAGGDRVATQPAAADDRTGGSPDVSGDSPAVILSEDEYTLLRVCEAILHLFEGEGETIWPGYSLAEQPFMVYVTDRWALLFNPQGPVEGFGAYPKDWPDLGAEVLYHDGRYDELAGQLVFDVKLGEITTLAVGFPSEFPDRIQNPAAEAFAYIVHEAFHQYQHAAFSEIPWVREERYPISDYDNAAMAELEMQLLEEAVGAAEAGDREAVIARTKEFLTIRLHRWTTADRLVSEYEQGQELQEGTAKYVELKCLEAMPRVHYTSSMDGVADPLAAFFPEATMPLLLLEELRERMGDGCLEPQDIPRNRIYAVAAAQAYLLDYFGLDWKGQAEAGEAEFHYRDTLMPGYPGFEYAALLERNLGLSGLETPELDARAKRAHDYDSIVACTRQAWEDYSLGYKKELETFENQEGRRIELVVPTSNLSRSRVSRADKWVMDGGRFVLCGNFEVYTLSGGDWRLELHDAGLLEVNDWDEGLKQVVFYDAGVDSVSLDGRAVKVPGGAVEAPSQSGTDFNELEIAGERFTLEVGEPGRFTATGDTLKIKLVKQ